MAAPPLDAGLCFLSPPQAGPPIVRGGYTDTDSAELATLEYSSSFDSFELDYRKRWVAPNCRFHGSWMVGARYVKIDEQLVHGTVVNYLDPNGTGGAPFWGDGEIQRPGDNHIDDGNPPFYPRVQYFFVKNRDFDEAVDPVTEDAGG